jgi:DNA invertase Pin-like site-specific DNA recombinase
MADKIEMLRLPVAIFVRVSKQSQDYQRQISDLQAYATRQGYEVVKVISEKISGAADNREGIAELLELVESGQIQKVLVSEVSRLGRKTSEVLQVVDELTDQGVSIYVQNFGMETLLPNGKRNSAAGIIFTLLAEFARMERETMIERINSGLAEAKRIGKKFGRPEGSTMTQAELLEKYPKVVKLLKQGQSIRNTAAIAGVSSKTVEKVKKAFTV